MGEFEISKLGKALLEELVGKDARLRQAIHTLSDLHVYIPALGLGAIP